MALVGYSDSEDSDSEVVQQPKASTPAKTTKPSFEKLVDSSGPRKIKVDLPATAPIAKSDTDERPAKRARTAGGLSGFNALLPAPKRTAENAKRGGLGSGVSLKTSSAAAFSREPVEPQAHDLSAHAMGGDQKINDPTNEHNQTEAPKQVEEVKTVGNAMRFRPLSVANKKKTKKPTAANGSAAALAQTTQPSPVVAKETPAKSTKPKVSLFSVASEEELPARAPQTGAYEPLFASEAAEQVAAPADAMFNQPVDPNSLDAVASDLNLSEADRRMLFGRRGQGGQAVNVANFNMDREYAKNEEIRAAGETVQHRAVRAVAPGKHSLQQLVNAATTQKDALEDAWAEGKRNRGEAGNKYGWGR
ncbi:Hypothetical protein D9617_13g100550 [Elsinoe fawcettii]|nr:Hypothetical protein D9617_13g100550 [Elsinoe fawcettii]